MKHLVTKILGKYTTLRLTDIKRKYSPSAKNKIFLKEEAEYNENRKKFYGSIINKNDLCFDVGANVGNRIAPLLEIGAKVVAVEPQDHCVKFLKYKFGDTITIINKGLGEAESVKDFYISNLSVLSSFSEDWITSVKNTRFKAYNWNKVVKVEMTTLDKIIEKYGKPAFIKIDVEGYEVEVLKGLTQPVKMISFEYTVPEQTVKAIQCLELINKFNKNIECNYSVGESMIYESAQWLNFDAMKRHVETDSFLKTHFGDIYVRTKS